MHIFTRSILFTVSFLFSVEGFAQPTNGLVAHWTFNGNAYDSTGKGHNGTMNNVTATTGKAGAANTAVRFNGSPSSIVTVPYQSDLNISNYSICAVVKPEGFYTNSCQISMLLARGVDHGDQGAYFLNMTDNVYDSTCTQADTNKFVFTCGGGPSNYPYHLSWADSPRVHTNKWYCVVGTFDGSAFKLYIDGVLRVTAPPQSSPVPIGSSTDGLSIGGNIFGNASLYPYWFKGVMDDLRLYDRALADSEIASYCIPAGDGPGDTSAHVSHIMTSLSLAVVPNPNAGSFYLEGIVGSGNAAVEVCNMVGQAVYKARLAPVGGMVRERIDLSDMVDGIYFVKVTAGEEHRTYRVLIQR